MGYDSRDICDNDKEQVMNRWARIIDFLRLIAIIAIVISSYPAQADVQSSQKTLSQYVADLQKNPNNFTLREKIIKHVQGMRPAPAIPEEARRYFVKANTFQKGSKDIRDYGLSINAYDEALLIAPWWPEAYYSLSIAHERSDHFDEAVKALKLYLMTNPSASEAREAQDKIYALEAKKDISQAARGSEKKIVEREKKRLRETGRDGRFIAYADGTVLDTQTNLMWAAKDNGYNINSYNAKRYCENYRGGGYTDWRMPTQDELAGLYDAAKTYKSDRGHDVHLTELIRLTCFAPWASETSGSNSASFNFSNGMRYWHRQSRGSFYRALPVRFGK